MLVTGCRRHRVDEIEACTPGVVYAVACDSMGVGRCSGDAIIRVCDGASSTQECADGTVPYLAEDDDSGEGRCPHATATCPTSGAFAVATRAYDSGGYSCDWRVEPVGSTGPLVEADGGP